MGDEAFTHDGFLSHSAKDKVVVRSSSLSASNGERIRRKSSRLEPLNLPWRILSDKSGAKDDRTPYAVASLLRHVVARSVWSAVGFSAALGWGFMGSLSLQQSDAHWDHEPSEEPQRNGGTQSWLLCAPSFLCGSIGRFMERSSLSSQSVKQPLSSVLSPLLRRGERKIYRVPRSVRP